MISTTLRPMYSCVGSTLIIRRTDSWPMLVAVVKSVQPFAESRHVHIWSTKSSSSPSRGCPLLERSDVPKGGYHQQPQSACTAWYQQQNQLLVTSWWPSCEIGLCWAMRNGTRHSCKGIEYIVWYSIEPILVDIDKFCLHMNRTN